MVAVEEFPKRCVTLTLTEQCNLSCVYCYEGNKSARCMSLETAKRIISSELNGDSSEEITFELFGGEPFVNFSLIKSIVEFLRKNFSKKKYKVFITSNGTLINKDIQKWLIDNKDIVTVGLSLDGDKEMQNINRSNSFERIDIDFFAKHYPKQTVKMTVSDKTLSNLSRGVIFLHNRGFRVHCNFAFGLNWNDVSYQKELYLQLKNLVKYYLDNNIGEPCSMLNFNLEYVTRNRPDYLHRWCGTGHMHTYDVLGNCYPCQFFMPISMGDKSQKINEISIPKNIPISCMDLRCQSCSMKLICPTCYGSNYLQYGTPYRKDEGYCILMKIVFLANSYYRYKMLENGYYDNDLEQKMRIMNGVKIVQEDLLKDDIISKLKSV